jgi:hypothetical protein
MTEGVGVQMNCPSPNSLTGEQGEHCSNERSRGMLSAKPKKRDAERGQGHGVDERCM